MSSIYICHTVVHFIDLFYGSFSPEFHKIYQSWNIEIRPLLNLPYNTSYLGPLIGLLHPR